MCKTKIISILSVVTFTMSGCSIISFGLSSDTNEQLDSREWKPVNSNEVKAYNE